MKKTEKAAWFSQKPAVEGFMDVQEQGPDPTLKMAPPSQSGPETQIKTLPMLEIFCSSMSKDSIKPRLKQQDRSLKLKCPHIFWKMASMEL